MIDSYITKHENSFFSVYISNIIFNYWIMYIIF